MKKNCSTSHFKARQLLLDYPGCLILAFGSWWWWRLTLGTKDCWRKPNVFNSSDWNVTILSSKLLNKNRMFHVLIIADESTGCSEFETYGHHLATTVSCCRMVTTHCLWNLKSSPRTHTWVPSYPLGSDILQRMFCGISRKRNQVCMGWKVQFILFVNFFAYPSLKNVLRSTCGRVGLPWRLKMCLLLAIKLVHISSSLPDTFFALWNERRMVKECLLFQAKCHSYNFLQQTVW